MSSHEHDAGAPARVRFAVLTVSDTRTHATDSGGQLVVELVEATGQAVSCRALCRDEPDAVRTQVIESCSREDVDAMVVTGGTGISPRDRTPETLAALYELQAPGFGELFRMLSFAEIGARAMLSRASAGIVQGRPVFSLPGSLAAVRLGMTRLVLPEIAHVVAQLRRGRGCRS